MGFKICKIMLDRAFTKDYPKAGKKLKIQLNILAMLVTKKYLADKLINLGRYEAPTLFNKNSRLNPKIN